MSSLLLRALFRKWSLPIHRGPLLERQMDGTVPQRRTLAHKGGGMASGWSVVLNIVKWPSKLFLQGKVIHAIGI